MVRVVIHADGKSFRGKVEPSDFMLCTYEQFMEKYPDAKLVTDIYTLEQLKAISNIEEEEEKVKMDLIMDKEKIGSYELTAEERESLRKEIKDLLSEYDYSPTDMGVNAILDKWIENKGWMINLFKQHPNYNGKFQIAFDSDYNRVCDKNNLYDFKKYFSKVAKNRVLKEKKLGGFSYDETYVIYSKLKGIVDYLKDLSQCYGYRPSDYKEKVAECERWRNKYELYKAEIRRGNLLKEGDRTYDIESYNTYKRAFYFADDLYYMRQPLADGDFVRKVNEYFPKVKAVVGQKVSRIVGKLAKQLGIDKDADWNREYAKYCDAINPLAVKRHTVLSCHPVDYFTMSFGNSWASCHTIDKDNKRGMPNGYEGQYSSGTLSYMLDESSFVYYTVDKDYNGNELELQDKINRNMFHMGKDKLIQARVYPQTTDGEEGIYKQIREIAQKVIADCLNIPNLWTNNKGTSECSYVTCSYGTHYRDYTSFSDCNVSYIKRETDWKNAESISIGHNPICPRCGREHTYQKAVECSECYTGGMCCCECDYEGDSGEMHLIDGCWYCESCCFYCNYHERWEIGDIDEQTYIDGYGYVCDEAIDSSGHFYSCDRCGCVFSVDDDYIETADGNHYCCDRCAERDDYVFLDDGEWYSKDVLFYCNCCGRYVHKDDWNEELGCCLDCEEDVREEDEEELEEVS